MKGRKHREAGGVNEAEEDVKTKPMRYTADSKVNEEAEERKAGGRAARKRGGMAKKMVGKVEGEHEKERADRKPRKSGGSATSNPFSSARHGTPPAGRKMEAGLE